MIPFLDLARDYADVEVDARRRIDGVLASASYVLGRETIELEAAMRERLGAASTVAVSSGTSALALALDALGIGAGDAVVVPSFTFIATAGAVASIGATPVFADIDPATFLSGAGEMRAAIEAEFDRDGASFRHRRTGARLAALVPVHLYGRACAMDEILSLARETGVRVVEDAAQAIGADVGGKSVGTFGDAGCFSFYPTKNLGGAGDGGLVVSDDAETGARVARRRSHGSAPGSYEHAELGTNARMPELVAAVLNAKLARLDRWTARRREIAARYSALLDASTAREHLVLPAPCADESHVWHQYAVRIPAGGGASRRDRIGDALGEAGIQTRVFYPIPLHRQPCFGDAARPLRAAEAASREVLCLPIYPSLADESVARVAEALADAASRL